MVSLQNTFALVLIIPTISAPIYIADLANLFEENQLSKIKQYFVSPLVYL